MCVGLKKYSERVYDACIESFNALPVVGLLDNKFFCVHGGISPELHTLADLDRVCIQLCTRVILIAHELSHVRNYDILISSIAATLAGAITWIAHWGPWLGGGSRDDRDRGGGSGILGLLLFFLAPLAALLLQLGLSRQREFSADETGARMVGHPYGLISALQKLGAYNQRIPTTVLSPSTSALCIVKPSFGSGMLSSLFSTHPPLEDRIAALREMSVTPAR